MLRNVDFVYLIVHVGLDLHNHYFAIFILHVAWTQQNAAFAVAAFTIP